MEPKNFKFISPFELNENTFDLLDNQWMLILAGSKEKHNSMTASWGGFGILWNKPVAFIFIRPQRFTLQFVEHYEYFTLNFFDEKWRSALELCGSKSGCDIDKTKAAGLSISNLQSAITFNEARLVIECRKLYIDDIKPENFLDKGIIEKHYPKSNFHRLFIAEITSVYKEV
ncbi:MAG TPA: flavin reductase family protein [Bacteroidales bacterium]|nr:flavin reductase family protein [Bacteroidales bacterium]